MYLIIKVCSINIEFGHRVSIISCPSNVFPIVSVYVILWVNHNNLSAQGLAPTHLMLHCRDEPLSILEL